jgi:hypothetical protein
MTDATNKGGRPRKHPEGTTATERVTMSLAALKEAGGARKTFRLGPAAMQALQALKRSRRKATETEIVEAALIAAADQLARRRDP